MINPKLLTDYQMKGKLLWTNTNINNEFNPQTITVNGTYKFYDIIVAQDGIVMRIERIYASNMLFLLENSFGGFIRTREVQATSNSIIFSKGQIFQSYATATDNNYQCVPYQIIGYE